MPFGCNYDMQYICCREHLRGNFDLTCWVWFNDQMSYDAMLDLWFIVKNWYELKNICFMNIGAVWRGNKEVWNGKEKKMLNKQIKCSNFRSDDSGRSIYPYLFPPKFKGVVMIINLVIQ